MSRDGCCGGYDGGYDQGHIDATHETDIRVERETGYPSLTMLLNAWQAVEGKPQKKSYSRRNCVCKGKWAPIGRFTMVMQDHGVHEMVVFQCIKCRLIRQERAACDSLKLERKASNEERSTTPSST